MLSLTRRFFSRLYNTKYRHRTGFYDTSVKGLKESPNHACSWKMPTGVENYGFEIKKSNDKIEALEQTLQQILAPRPNSRICIYAQRRFFPILLNSIKILKEYPTDKNLQRLAMRVYRRGGQVLLLSHDIPSKHPECDVMIHYNMPKSVASFPRGCSGKDTNIYFYDGNEKVTMAHLQNTFKFTIKPWHLPDPREAISKFVDGIASTLKNAPPIHEFGDDLVAKDPVPFVFTNITKYCPIYSVLAALLYILHKKSKAVELKKYLLFDPGFKKFKSRDDVVKYLHENNIYNYRGISLTRRGFIVESYDFLQLPLTQSKKIGSFLKIKRKLDRGYISSPRLKTRVFDKLAKAHERKVIRALRFKNLTAQTDE